MQYVMKPSITFQSSLYWSATDAPAVNPTQALSHFCSLMGENEKRDTRTMQDCVYLWKQLSSPKWPLIWLSTMWYVYHYCVCQTSFRLKNCVVSQKGQARKNTGSGSGDLLSCHGAATSMSCCHLVCKETRGPSSPPVYSWTKTHPLF